MTGWEEALRELIKEPPSERIRHAVIDIMRSKADDRSAALTVSALTETGIIAGITTVLQPKAEDVGPLFWNKKAKHGSFNQRIREAVRLGLIGTETSRNLDVIRQVRNAFAHSMIKVTFTTPAIEAACDTLKVPQNAQSSVHSENARKTRYRYCYACDAIFRGLLGNSVARWITGTAGNKPSQPILP